jgi:hypothetical protein
MESAVLVTIAVLAGSQSAEVLDSLGDSLETKKGYESLRKKGDDHHDQTTTHLSKKTNDNTAKSFITLLNVKVDFEGGLAPVQFYTPIKRDSVILPLLEMTGPLAAETKVVNATKTKATRKAKLTRAMIRSKRSV